MTNADMLTAKIAITKVNPAGSGGSSRRVRFFFNARQHSEVLGDTGRVLVDASMAPTNSADEKLVMDFTLTPSATRFPDNARMVSIKKTKKGKDSGQRDVQFNLPPEIEWPLTRATEVRGMLRQVGDEVHGTLPQWHFVLVIDLAPVGHVEPPVAAPKPEGTQLPLVESCAQTGQDTAAKAGMASYGELVALREQVAANHRATVEWQCQMLQELHKLAEATASLATSAKLIRTNGVPAQLPERHYASLQTIATCVLNPPKEDADASE